MPTIGPSCARVIVGPKEMNTGFLLSASNDNHLFSSLLEGAPFLVWVSDERGRLRYANKTWLEFTGRPIEAQIGDGWISNVHPEDVKERVECFQMAAGKSLPFNAEYRLRRADGEYRWICDMAKPVMSQDGQLAGYYGCCTDIMDLKESENARRELSVRLIDVQEAERTRIGRELHDGIGQEMAILCVQMQRAGQPVSDVPGAVHPSLAELSNKAMKIASKISKLSHELHSSHLEFLGFKAAAREACREFTERRRIPVNCECEGVPSRIDGIVGLSLLRVLQEALHNIDKHSGAKNVTVEMTLEGEQIIMEIADNGRGFDVKQAGLVAGLGLISMRERMHLIGGTFEITSTPNVETRIVARAPMQPQIAMPSAAANR